MKKKHSEEAKRKISESTLRRYERIREQELLNRNGIEKKEIPLGLNVVSYNYFIKKYGKDVFDLLLQYVTVHNMHYFTSYQQRIRFYAFLFIHLKNPSITLNEMDVLLLRFFEMTKVLIGKKREPGFKKHTWIIDAKKLDEINTKTKELF